MQSQLLFVDKPFEALAALKGMFGCMIGQVVFPRKGFITYSANIRLVASV